MIITSDVVLKICKSDIVENSDINGEPILSPYVQQLSEINKWTSPQSSSLSALKILNSDHFVIIAKLESKTWKQNLKVQLTVQGL